jgi:hypothetical protein
LDVTLDFHRLVGKSRECIYGASIIGSRNKPPFQQGQDAANELLEANPENSCVDFYAQDQVRISDPKGNEIGDLINYILDYPANGFGKWHFNCDMWPPDFAHPNCH